LARICKQSARSSQYHRYRSYLLRLDLDQGRIRGLSWKTEVGAGQRAWFQIASSEDGLKYLATVYSDKKVYIGE
jgi:hypothetical protein